jgi:hypothetical protein
VTEFLIGTMAVLFTVAYTTLFVSLVPRERYVEGQSLLNGSRALSYVAGPSAGGLLVQVLTAPVALAFDVCSYVASALFLSRISPVEPPTQQSERGHVVAGLRFIFGNPVIRASLGATATINFFNFVFFALFILYATRELDVEPGTLGAILGAGALGGVIGSVVTGAVGRRIGIGPAFLVGCIVFPAPLVLVPLAEGPQWLILALLFLAEFGSGLGVMMLDISAGAIFAALIPDRLRARVFRRLLGGQLRRAPARRVRRRRARDRDRAAADALDRHAGRARRGALATPLADSPVPRPARAGRVEPARPRRSGCLSRAGAPARRSRDTGRRAPGPSKGLVGAA